MLRILGFITRLGMAGVILFLGLIYILLASVGIELPLIREAAWLIAFVLATMILLRHRA
jgi:hypothetical protein